VAAILLATLNARYLHASFGLRCLFANLGELRPDAAVAEFDINQRSVDIAESILASAPVVLGLGVYIWNAAATLELVAILRRLRPDLFIVLGGPEVSHEVDRQEITKLADCIITGEADVAFADVCRRRLRGETVPSVVHAPLPDPGALASPYPFYTDEDLTNRVVYVEASRGCPFSCEFCLSSLDVPVRQFPLEPFLADMDALHRRGLRRFKFVDRTFNLNVASSRRILEFFLARLSPDLFVHFEMIPDRLPAELREVIEKFPAGTLQFEVGVQTLNPEIEARIQRRQNHDRLFDNLGWIRTRTGVHLHLDLIAGLPGENLRSFGESFDKLIALRPQEIQAGILKRLRGAPVDRHTAAWGMVYNPAPPYEVLQTSAMSFDDLARVRRFAAFWDVFGNSGRFTAALPLAWGDGSPFAAMLALSDWLHARSVKTTGVALPRQFSLLFEWLTTGRGVTPEAAGAALADDWRRAGQRERPAWLPASVAWTSPPRRPAATLPARQARHRLSDEPGAPHLPNDGSSPTLDPT
jgi:Protein of unknown function (DUF4080)/Radical SAM superfamily